MQKSKEESTSSHNNSMVFNGNLYIFHAFDIGDDINLEKLEKSQVLMRRPLILPKYFKKYHIPLSVELPHPHETSAIYSCKIHSFGVISITYKIPFEETLEDLRKNINDIDENYQEQSVSDAALIFKKIRPFITKPKFFHLRTWYPVIQVDPEPTKMGTTTMKEQYGGMIASLIRFETEMLSEYQKNEILESAIGYYRGDLIVIDSEAAFVADSEFEEIFDLFEYANIQQLELQYFDKVLDKRLNVIYEQKIQPLPLTSYLPFIGVRKTTPFDLGRLKVDISVITERLENNVRLAGEAYYSEIYTLLVEKLGIPEWKESLNRKLEIVEDVQEVYQNQIESIREDLLSVLIIILIFIEMVIGLLSYFKE
jgi:hypothetical protein